MADSSYALEGLEESMARYAWLWVDWIRTCWLKARWGEGGLDSERDWQRWAFSEISCFFSFLSR